MTAPSDLSVVLKWHGGALITYKNHQSNDRWPGGLTSSDHRVQDNSLSGQSLWIQIFLHRCGYVGPIAQCGEAISH